MVVNDGTLDRRRSTPTRSTAVVTGLHRDFDYRATGGGGPRASHRGARLIGTNADPTYPTPNGLDPGGGSILAAIATAGVSSRSWRASRIGRWPT